MNRQTNDIETAENCAQSKTVRVDCGVRGEDCTIYGSEIYFNKKVSANDIAATAKDIWDNPSKFSDYKDNSDRAYYSFLKYLWIKFPNGDDVRLADYVNP